MSGRSGFGLIPGPAKILAALAFLAPVAFFFWIFDDHRAIGLGTAIGLGVGTIAAAFVLLAGYVYADAARRGMPPIPWTALAVLIPNGVGFVLYFLLRKPILHPLSHLRARSYTRRRVLSALRPTSNELGTTLMERILKAHCRSGLRPLALSTLMLAAASISAQGQSESTPPPLPP